MEREEIIEHMRISLSAVLNRDLTELPGETRIFDDLELDSMRFIELLMTLEDTIGLDVDPDSLAPEVFFTVDSFAGYIQNRLHHAPVG
ncbi:MAG TPA: phosphopantetheine-binding protein [Micromonosporaceae bacterium]